MATGVEEVSIGEHAFHLLISQEHGPTVFDYQAGGVFSWDDYRSFLDLGRDIFYGIIE